jgi:hypothetical protein
MTQYRTFVAIDPAKKCGWALWREDMPNPIYGTWTFEWGSDGQLFNGLMKRLYGLHKDFGGIDFICVEFNPGAMMGMRAAKLGYGWLTAIEMFGARMQPKIPVKVITTQQWRLDFIGRQEDRIIRNARKQAKAEGKDFNSRDIVKAATIARCKQLGWDPKDDNAADALGQLDSKIKDNGIKAPWYENEVLREPLGVVS